MKLQVPFGLVAALLVSAPAFAQFNYVVTQTTQTYVPLTGATDVTGQLVAQGSFDRLDEGVVSIPLPFAFPYYGSTYNSVGVTTNGLLLFGTAFTYCSSNNCFSNRGTPASASDPHNLIA